MNKQNMVPSYDGISFTVERNEALTPATMEMNLENMMLSERNQTQKITYHMMPPPPCLSPILCLNSKQRLHAKQNRRVQR